MPDTPDLVTCSKCHSRTWQEVGSKEYTKDQSPIYRFECIRCHHSISIKKCAKCASNSWTRLPDVYQEQGKKPIWRFKCQQCQRVLAILID